MGKIIGQITSPTTPNVAKTLAESNLTAAADKGKVFILAPNDGTARAIADVFAADADVTEYFVTGQDAVPPVQYIIDGKQSMTVLKDVRTLVADAIKAAVAFLEGGKPEETTTYNNGVIDVPAKPPPRLSPWTRPTSRPPSLTPVTTPLTCSPASKKALKLPLRKQKGSRYCSADQRRTPLDPG